MNRKSQAAIVLIIMTAGMLLTMNRAGFWVNLLHNGFLAAMIGGLADWFAITAIFKKPLGISWRTAILPRNRKRIMDEIIGFVGIDLLNTDNIMKDVIRYDMARMFIEYLNRLGGKSRIKDAAGPVLRELIKSADSGKFAAAAVSAVKKHRQNGFFSDIFPDLMMKMTSDAEFDKLVEVLNALAGKILHDDRTRAVMMPMIHDIREEYKRDSTLREMIIAMFDLSDENITDLVVKKMLSSCAALREHDSPQRQRLQKWCGDALFKELQKNGTDADAFRAAEKTVLNKINAADAIAKYIDEYKSDETNIEAAVEAVNGIIDSRIDAFIADEAIQRNFDKWLKKRLSLFVRESSPILLQMVKDKLNGYSTDDFIALVESHVSNDLQMIRINGSLVGGAAGMLLYALTYFAERICS